MCESCGLFAVANLKKNQFHCPACKNTTGIVQVQPSCFSILAPAAAEKQYFLKSTQACDQDGLHVGASHQREVMKEDATESDVTCMTMRSS